MPETTKNYHRIPVGKKKKDSKIRTINIGKGIKALYDAKNKIIVTYLFDVNKYSMKEAREWVKQHKDSAEMAQIIENLSLVKGQDGFYRDWKNETVEILKAND